MGIRDARVTKMGRWIVIGRAEGIDRELPITIQELVELLKYF
jgi:hypothetical protein